MKLVGELKKEVEKIETKEVKKEAIKKAGMELSDKELDQVAGGLFQEDSCRIIPPQGSTWFNPAPPENTPKLWGAGER